MGELFRARADLEMLAVPVTLAVSIVMSPYVLSRVDLHIIYVLLVLSMVMST